LATRQVYELVDEARASTPKGRSGHRIPGKANSKLASDQVERLIVFYEQGDSIYVLSRRFGIPRETVKDHLRRAKIVIRPGNQPKLTDSDKNEIVRLYESGLSIHKLALRFGVTDNPVHNVLKERGVKMRDPHGRVL
jgi:DNA invertase Pin-like site-specific DNA recombinase